MIQDLFLGFTMLAALIGLGLEMRLLQRRNESLQDDIDYLRRQLEAQRTADLLKHHLKK